MDQYLKNPEKKTNYLWDFLVAKLSKFYLTITETEKQKSIGQF